MDMEFAFGHAMDKGFEIAIVWIWGGIGGHDEMFTVGTSLNLSLPWWLFGMVNMTKSQNSDLASQTESSCS